MATGGIDTPDMYNCAVCLEHLQDRNPRYLACHHYFCQKCLQQLVKNNSITCPTCRKLTQVPHNNVTSLQINSLLVQVLERERQFTNKPPGVTTALCVLCNNLAAICKCRECGQLFCDACRHKHDKLKKFKDHIIQALCKKHPDSISHICMKCCEEICNQCIIMDHGDHEDEVLNSEEGTKKMKKIIDAIDEKLKYNVDVLKNKSKEVNYKKNRVETKMNNLKIQNTSLEMQIKANKSEIRNLEATSKKYMDDYSAVQKKQKEYSSICDAVTQSHGMSGSLFIQQFYQIQEATKNLKLDVKELLHRRDNTCGNTYIYSRCRMCDIYICKECCLKCHSFHHKHDPSKMFAYPYNQKCQCRM